MSAGNPPDETALTRAQLLREMGLSPQWQLRAQRSVWRVTSAVSAEASAERASPPVALVTASSAKPGVSAIGAPVTDREQQIADLDWDGLRQGVADCRACGLCQERRQAVLGVGDINADWLFVGEGPGAEEDARGEPFVGAAGKLLDAMLAAIDLKRGSDVYIANAVKCRPPGNRTPEAAELAVCAPYLRRQIALIRPRVIVLLGRAAVHAVLGEVGSLAGLRGKSFVYPAAENGGQAIPVVVTYHPAYLLRSMPDKAKAWEDLCRARTLMRAAKATPSLPI